MTSVTTGAYHVPVMMGRRRSQETVRGGNRVSGSELAKLLLMGQFLGPFGFQQLLMLERDLRVLRLEELLLLQLSHSVGLVQLSLPAQLRFGDALLLELQRSGCNKLRAAGGGESRRRKGEGRAHCRCRDWSMGGTCHGSSGSGALSDKLGGITLLGRWLVHARQVRVDRSSHRKVKRPGGAYQPDAWRTYSAWLISGDLRRGEGWDRLSYRIAQCVV